MPISKGFSFTLGFVLLAVSALAVTAEGVRFRSWDDALKQGISAYKGGYYELALPALEAAEAGARAAGPDAEASLYDAQYHMARIYADNDGAYTNPERAYKIFRHLADTLRNVDPADENLAPIAAKSLTQVSQVLRRGLPAAGVEADPIAANRALQSAALTFNDEDAQFELAKVLLRGEGPMLVLGRDDDPQRKIAHGRHWLARLSSQGHAPAQAFFADLLWRGRFVEKDQLAALNLIDVAVANAPPEDRVWIEDIYQNIFCNAGEGVRRQATGRVAEWRDRYGRQYAPRVESNAWATLTARPVRTCADGEEVRPVDARREEPTVIAEPTPLATETPTFADVETAKPVTPRAFAPANTSPALESGFPMPSFSDR